MLGTSIVPSDAPSGPNASKVSPPMMPSVHTMPTARGNGGAHSTRKLAPNRLRPCVPDPSITPSSTSTESALLAGPTIWLGPTVRRRRSITPSSKSSITKVPVSKPAGVSSGER